MPTVLTHPAVPVALCLGLGSRVIPYRLLLTGMAVSILPDLDVLAFRFGISYASDFGHRGVSHSLAFAAMAALLGACALRNGSSKTFWFLFAVSASHGVLDAFTNGGLGIAFLWPFSAGRYFAPIRSIEVSPLSIKRFLSHRGAAVITSELLWVWLPCMTVGILAAVRRWRPLRRKLTI